MLKLIDKPFLWYPPRPHPIISPVGRLYNKYVYLPGKSHLIKEFHCSGREKIRELRADRRNRFLFLANHPSHSDPQIIMESLRGMGISSHYLTSYDLFYRRTPFERWAMQKSGAFSIDRESFNARPFNVAAGIVRDGKHALTIFPEGRPYLQNDLVTPFMSGAVYIGLAAQKALLGTDKKVFLVPTAVKLTHTEDCLSLLMRMLLRLADDIGYNPGRTDDPVALAENTAIALMQRALKSFGYPMVEEGSLETMRDQAAEIIIRDLETRTGWANGEEKDPWKRVLAIRSGIHRILLDPDRNLPLVPAAGQWARRALTAMKIISYPVNYLRENPTLDRFGEVVERLLEDRQSVAIPPYSGRAVFTRFGNPVDLSALMSGSQVKRNQLKQELSDTIRTEIQVLIDSINAENAYPGAAYITEV
ncbi:MAG: lysophospholipid acyltransferase family protein [Sediminispirochaetaceae bacterium]